MVQQVAQTVGERTKWVHDIAGLERGWQDKPKVAGPEQSATMAKGVAVAAAAQTVTPPFASASTPKADLTPQEVLPLEHVKRNVAARRTVSAGRQAHVPEPAGFQSNGGFDSVGGFSEHNMAVVAKLVADFEALAKVDDDVRDGRGLHQQLQIPAG